MATTKTLPSPWGIDLTLSHIERDETTLGLLAWFGQPLKSRLEAKMGLVLDLYRQREAKGFTVWDTRSPLYAGNIKKVNSFLFGGVQHYAELAAEIRKGNKRYKQQHLDTVVVRVLLPALDIDLSAPKYHPITPKDWPGYKPRYESQDENGRKVTNCHRCDGEYVWLRWDYMDLEPSYWICYIGQAYGLSELNPADAVSKAKALVANWRQMDIERKTKPYTLADLEKVQGFELRSIARARGMQIPKSNKLSYLRLAIAQPQLTLLETL